MRSVLVLLLAAVAATGQKPVIFRRGIVNAASFAPGNRDMYAIRRLRAKPDKIIVDVHAASPST